MTGDIEFPETQLLDRLNEAWQSITDLAITVNEDHPSDADLAVVDDLRDRVGDIQGSLDDARRLLPRTTPLAEVSEANRLYWMHLRAFRPVYELRRAARGRGREWQTWVGGVELAVARCESPLTALDGALIQRVGFSDGPGFTRTQHRHGGSRE